MAAEIPVDLSKEADQVKKTLLKIGKYIARHRHSRTMKAGTQIRLYDKVVEVRPTSWHISGDAFVLKVAPFDLNEAEWEGWGADSELICHYDASGKLKGVYNLL